MEKKSNVLDIGENDINFEENILNNPQRIKPWFHYIESKKRRFKSVKEVFVLYERALRQFPGSYKLWYNYLIIRMNSVKNRNLSEKCWEDVNECFEKALYTMHKMPVIWKEYLKFLILQKFVTRVRKTFDRCLKSLPITQHEQIWEMCLNWIRSNDYIPFKTCNSLFLRYLKLFPAKMFPEYVLFLSKKKNFGELCKVLKELLLMNRSRVDKEAIKFDKIEIWKLICKIIRDHPFDIAKSNFGVEEILRFGLKNRALRNTTEFVEGEIWVTLANYYVVLGNFEKARDIFEESLETITRIRDFTTIFDSYAKFEEMITQAKMEMVNKKKMMNDNEDEDSDEDSDEEEDDTLSLEESISFCLQRWENLLERRPFLLNEVRIRQNPHSVFEWLRKIRLFLESSKKESFEISSKKVIEIFSEALETINPMECTGKISSIWIEFAKYYEEQFEDIERSRKIFELAIQQPFKSLQELSQIYCEYCEMEIRNKNIEKGKQLIEGVLFSNIPDNLKEFYGNFNSRTVQERIFRSLQLWSLLIDLNESMGDLNECKKCYDRLVDLKLITPSLLINYCSLLFQSSFFQECWRMYEKGISLFSFPQVLYVFSQYLIHYLKRVTSNWKRKSISSNIVESTRELFDRCMRNITDKNELSLNLYLMYVKFEENYGRVKRAMEIIDRGMDSNHLETKEKGVLFKIYVQSASQYYSISRIREIYQKGIEIMPQELLKDHVLLKFIELEMKLGEIDRARALFANGTRICGNLDDKFFSEWEDFENRFGNLETFKEMYKIKESYENQ